MHGFLDSCELVDSIQYTYILAVYNVLELLKPVISIATTKLSEFSVIVKSSTEKYVYCIYCRSTHSML